MARERTGVKATCAAQEVNDENAVKSGSNVVIISVPAGNETRILITAIY